MTTAESTCPRSRPWRGWVPLAVSWLAASAASGADVPPPKPVATAESAGRMTVPAGVSVTLFAGEPDVVQPIALAFDPRGRLWVAECFSYPQWEMNGRPGRDRILILEDADGDGRFDKRTVFTDKVTNISGLELGFGGVWVCSTPNLMFIPDRDRDDRPDGPPEVVLDGWDLKARHNVFNGLTWGPDGWLWGCNGILSNSKVGPPGTPEARRVALNCGVWRYHPTRRVFEAVAHGTTNPWGLDFDELGEAFITNCVIPHLFHVVPGAHFERMFGQDVNPNSYGLIASCADHVHWDTAAERWLDIRTRGVTPTTDKAGGGHAHSGAAFGLSHLASPELRQSVFMGNIHGNRINRDVLERSGSGYVARHAADYLQANDRWFRSVAQKVGPDGGLYLLDWSDTGECHEDDADGAHRENGRIYRVAFAPDRRAAVDLAGLDDEALARLQASRNESDVRQSRRLLQERAAAGRDVGKALVALRAGLRDQGAAEPVRLRALWALHAAKGLDEPGLAVLLADPSEHLRAWAVRLLVDDASTPPSATTLGRFQSLAKADPSPKVRLALASASQRLPLDRRAAVVEGLLGHPEDARDRNLPLMVWYGVEPLVPGDLPRASSWAATAGLPTVRRFLARRIVSVDPNAGLRSLAARLGSEPSLAPEALLDALLGVSDGLEGRKSVPEPAGWAALERRAEGFARVDVLRQVRRLSLRFGNPETVRRLRAEVRSGASADDRRWALEALAEARVPGLAADLIERLDDPALRAPALRALAGYDNPGVPSAVLKRFQAMSVSERDDAVETLASRPAWALALLGAVGRGEVARRDLSVSVARQIQAFGRPDLDQALLNAWGALRPASAEKAALMARYKGLLTTGSVASASAGRGRLVFERTCRPCHKIYGEGGEVGPELTGSNRDNLDYVLTNVLDPNASVSNDYRLTNVATTDGRLVSGLIKEQTASAVVVQTINGRVVVPRDEVEEVRTTAVSMMPEGLFEKLGDDEVRDLVAYLATRSQPPLPPPSADGK